MKINIFDINKMIEINELPEVTTPILFESTGEPNKDGLFSYELFGVPNSYDRKTLFGYIDLKRKFLHPMIYKNLITLDRRMVGIVKGEKKYKLNQLGELVEDDNGETGLDFLYKNLKKIKFRRSKSSMRENKLKMIEKSPIDTLFIDKFLVTPPFYRDFNPAKSGKGKTSYDEINKQYSKLINMSMSLEDDELGISFMSHITENRMQLLLVEIYEELVNSLPKKTGYIRKHLMGKSVDYATRGVITAPPFREGTWNTLLVPFGYTGLPLAMVVVLFNLHIIYEIRNYLDTKITGRFLESIDSKGNKVDVEVDEFALDTFTPEYIKKNIMELYIQGIDKRFEPVKVKNIDGEDVSIAINQDGKDREMTIIDLLYIASVRAIGVDNLHVWVTRYPVQSYQSAYPSRVRVLTTKNVKESVVDGIDYDYYPVMAETDKKKNDNELTNLYYDSIIVGNEVLGALGGDYDGDTVSVRGVYSVEANEEAKKIMYSKKHMLNLEGETARELINEGIQTLFALTR